MLKIRDPANFYTQSEVSHTSQGRIGLIVPDGPGRLKGLMTDVVETKEEAGILNDVLQHGRFLLRTRPGYDRITIKVIVRSDSEIIGRLNGVEAIIPLDRASSNTAFSEYSLVYLGHNLPSRMPDLQTIESYASKIREADLNPARRSTQHIRDALSAAESRGMSNTILDGHTASFRITQGAEFTQICELLMVHGYVTPSQVRSVLTNPNNITLLTRDASGNVIGMMMAEFLDIHLSNGMDIRIVEPTNSSVDKTHRGNGVYDIFMMGMLTHLSQNATSLGIDLIFTETNLEGRQVFSLNQHGRYVTFGLHEGNQTGYLGILPNHTTINGIPRSFVANYVDTRIVNSTDADILASLSRLRREE